MILSHIVAASENNVIGRNNGLPWHIPEDLKFFREKTSGRAVIMGRKTFDSVGRPLPDRLNIVITKQKDYHPEGTVVVASLKEALALCEKQLDKYGEEVFIIGGGEIFKDTLSLIDIIYLTRIHKSFDGDVFYPDISKKDFEVIERRERTEPVPFTFLTYRRKNAF